MADRADSTGAHVEHIDQLAERAAYRSEFDRILLTYLELLPRSGATGLRDGRRQAMRTALDDRASWDQIRDWRHGYRRTPAWATLLLQSKIEKRIATLEALRRSA